MPLCECKQKWCAQCNPARGFVEGMPMAEVVTNRPKVEPPVPGHVALLTGWICPLCRCGVSPKVEVCPCSATDR